MKNDDLDAKYLKYVLFEDFSGSIKIRGSSRFLVEDLMKIDRKWGPGDSIS
jgi:hypothetical protein